MNTHSMPVQIRPEERILANRFGDVYGEYRRRVRR